MSEKHKMEESKKTNVLLGEMVSLLKVIVEKSGIKIVDGRFTDNGNDTINDKKNGLMWAKKGSGKTMTFSEAENYCKELNLGGHQDWRLPTVEELLTLVDYTKTEPAINPVFDCESNWYWTSTPYAGNTDYAWMVFFSDGSSDWGHRLNYYYVRPVRQY